MVDVQVAVGSAGRAEADALLLFLTQDPDISTGEAGALDTLLSGALNESIEGGDFTGKAEQVGVIYTRGAIPARRVILAGLGKADELNAESVRRAAAVAVKKTQDLGATNAAVVLPPMDVTLGAQAIVEGALLALYTFRGLKSTPDENKKLTALTIICEDEQRETATSGVRTGLALARATLLARDLANQPPNICTPEYLAEQAITVAKNSGLRAEILERHQMESLKMGALLGVAQGSSNPPRFIILEHNAAKVETLDTIVLVGKGVTFDTGGFTIKTGDGMIGMKGDMSGAAAVIGAMQAVAELALPLHVIGLIPASENLIDSQAYRPQDVLTASNGKTIEIISTDAEGRLLLADALVYAGRFQPAAVVDIATLTGSITVALGKVMAGLFSTDDSLRDVIIQAGEAASERVWPMPLMPEYRKLIDTDSADMKNSGGRSGGASIAAAFLKEFTDYPRWAHIDIAGPFVDLPGIPYVPAKGMNGWGTRLLVEFVRGWSARKGA